MQTLGECKRGLQVKYQLQFLPLNHDSLAPLHAIENIEKSLVEKKGEMSLFQSEFLDAKRKCVSACCTWENGGGSCRYEEATTRLKAETEMIMKLLREREKGYEELLENSARPYLTSGVVVSGKEKGGGGLFSSFFG